MTPEEAKEAIAGERRVSVFFADEVSVVRMQRRLPDGGLPPPFSLLPSEPGEIWELAGEPERLKRGSYGIPMFAGRQQAFVVLALADLAGVNPPSGLGLLLGIVIEHKGVRYLLHESTGIFAEPVPARCFPGSATLDLVTESPKRQTQAETHSPVTLVDEGASTGPVQGLSTRDIANAFDGVFAWTVERWIKNLSAAKWAQPARVACGERGGASALWNPLILAQQLHIKRADMQIVARRFRTILALEPWRDAFNEYFETHCVGD